LPDNRALTGIIALAAVGVAAGLVLLVLILAAPRNPTAKGPATTQARAATPPPEGAAPDGKARPGDVEPTAAAASVLGVGATVVAGVVCISVLSIFVYLLPVLIAVLRGHPDVTAIAVVTLLFGWTFIGWGIALVWSVKSFAPPPNPDGQVKSRPR
jgi:hypothetical protein